MPTGPKGEKRPNWKNQTIWTSDNLDIMRGMNSATVDLIYLDPPFNSSHNYAAPIGSKAAGAAFKDTWGLDDINLAWHGEIKHEQAGLYSLLAATREIHGDSMMSYLIYMAIRVMEMKRLLKPTGSIYLHCDPTAGHYLKLLMDAVFGPNACRNEIAWCYTGPGSPRMRQFNRKHDTLYWYARGKSWTFNADAVRVPHTKLNTNRAGAMIADALTDEVREGYLAKGKVPETWWTKFSPVGRRASERTGYPTQKPLALLRRVIDASSNPNDMVLDPFCGCATACIAAEQRGRRWAGIDIAPKAADLVRSRMEDELGLFFNGDHRTDVPQRTDLGRVIRYNDARNKRHLYGEQGGYCNGCEEHFELRHFHVDHIVSRAKGGTDHISNLQLLCGACNALKGAKTQEELIVMLTDKGWIKRKKAT